MFNKNQSVNQSRRTHTLHTQLHRRNLIVVATAQLPPAWVSVTQMFYRSGRSASSTFSLVTISGRAPYTVVDVRRPSFSGRRLSSLEQFATPRHVCTVTACFLQSSEDLSLQPQQFSLTILLCPRSDTCHYENINRSYLLTYLLTLHCRPWNDRRNSHTNSRPAQFAMSADEVELRQDDIPSA